MNLFKKRQILLLFILYTSIVFSQTAKTDSLRGQFTYLMQYKPNTLTKDYIIKDFFSLQITDSQAFYVSENKLKFDSAFSAQYNKKGNNIDLSMLQPARSTFLIIQKSDASEFYEKVGFTLFYYNIPKIKDWKLVNESKKINSFICKKAELRYKGRDWTAWYSVEIPLPYGPYKLSGLPGLIVKITDKTGDYDFELIKSVSSANLKGKVLSINTDRYNNAKLITQKELVEARKNFRDNAKHELESMGTVFSQDQKDRLRINETEKKGYNPLELED